MSADFDSIESGIRKMGYLRKLKTMKKKFFILRTETNTSPPTLEYYDNEKKYRHQGAPKRVVNLRTCFNINKKLDTKQKYALALYTKDDCFAMVAETKEEQEEWLDVLLELQQGAHPLDGEEKPKPTFEHVWEVTVKNKGLGSSKSIVGSYRLCLTSKALSLIKMNVEKLEVLEFPLMSVRRCGHSNCFFFMELGRSAMTGAGELWMQTDDTIIAQNMHEAILGAMRASSSKEDLGPLPRSRSSSATEASKPISVHPRRGTSNTPNRERSDSMPTRSRTVSEGEKNLSRYNFTTSSRMSALPPSASDMLRPQSMYNRNLSYSPPAGSNNPISPSSGPCSTDSAGSSQSIDDNDCSYNDSHFMRFTHQRSLTPETPLHEPPIREEIDDYIPHSPTCPDLSFVSSLPLEGYMQMSPVSSMSPLPNIQSPGTPSSKPNYLDMSPLETALSEAGYIPMSPVSRYSNFSEASAVLSGKGSREEPPDSYVEMKCLSDQQAVSHTEIDGYLDMTPTSQTSSANKDRDDSSYLSMSPTVTPIPDFSEFHLDKVQSYLITTEDDDKRPIRAYSVGSRPSSSRKAALSDTERVRAYSVGSRMAVPIGKGHDNLGRNLASTPEGKEEVKKMSNSAPHLGEQGVNSGHSTPTSRILRSQYSKMNRSEDLMEIDFNNPIGSSIESVKTSQDSLKKSSEKISTESISGKRSRSNSKSLSHRPQIGNEYFDLTSVNREIKKAEIVKEIKKSSSREFKKSDSQETKESYFELKTEAKISKLDRPVIGTNKESISSAVRSESKVLNVDYMEMKIDSGIKKEHDGKKKPLKEKGKNIKVNIDKNQEVIDEILRKTNSGSNLRQLGISSAEKESSPGEYVNIDFSKDSQRSSIVSNPVKSTEATSEKSTSKTIIGSSDYMNINIHRKVGLCSMTGMSDYTVMAPVATSGLSGKINSGKCGLLASLGKSQTLPSGGCKKSPMLQKSESSPKYSSSSLGSKGPISPSSKLYSTLPPSVKSTPLSNSPQLPGSPVSKTPGSPSHISKVEEIQLRTSHLLDQYSTQWCTPVTVAQKSSSNQSSGSSCASDLKYKLVNLVKSPKKHSFTSLPNTKESTPKSASGSSSPALYEAPYENITVGLSSSRHSSGSSGERELNYASLDLGSMEDDDKCPRSPRTSKSSYDSSVFEDDSKLTYAEIDFTKSEGLRNTSTSMRESRF